MHIHTFAATPAAAGVAANNTNKKVTFKNCAPVTFCMSKMNNTQATNVYYVYVVMATYSLMEDSDIFSKKYGSLWQ